MIYRLDYCDAQGNDLRLDIQYGSNTVINVEGTGNPFTLNYKGDKDDKSLKFLTSSADISLFETEDFNIDILKTSSETAISVKYYVNSNLFWQGYVIPDFFSKEITGTPIINMVASDRLSTLKSVSLASDTLPSMITFRELAIKCLQKTGLSLPLKTVANFSNGTGSATDGFFTSKVLTQRLSDTKGRNISCYDILDSILTASGSKLMQRGGEWVIINKDQHERGVGTAFNTPTTNITPTGSHAWSEVVHNFSDISVGGRRTIIPVASSVGVYNEFGGSKRYPENYDFSDGLTGWTAVKGFVAGINNKEVIGYTGGISNFVPIYGNDVETNSVINNNASFSDSSSPYLKSENVAVNYPDNDNVNVTVEVNATGVGSYITNSFVEFAIIATNTVTLNQLSLSSNGVFETMTADEPHLHRIKFPTVSSLYNASTGSLQVEGVLIGGAENLGDYDIHIRIYGSGGNRTSFINSTTIKYSVGGDTPKGNLYKTAQGSNFTKQHDIETTIFGDYIRGGVNGYFYNYPIDDTSLIYNASNELTSLWTTPTTPHDTSEQPLLLHIAKQKARMFSIAHDLLDVSLDIDNFDPLKIFVNCFGRRYVVVASEYDLLRSRARVTVEQIAFNGTIFKQDFIYSYFGDGEEGIKSIGGISSSAGGGGTSGGLTPEQLEILSFWKKDPDNPNTIFTEMNAYSKLELSAYGVGSGGGGGGSDYERLDTWADYDSAKAGWVLSAFLGNDLNTRVTDLENSAGGGGSGSVTSVGISVPTGLSVSNSPITSSGVIAIGLQTGYSIPTTAKQNNWDTAYSNTHTHSNKTVLDGITSALVSNWNTAFTNNHTHANKTQLDLITQSNIDVLAKLSIVNGNLQIDGNAYATGELSAYGVGSGGGGGGGGIIETVYGYSNLGQTFNNNILTDTFNAYTINQINTRLVSVENGSATTVNTTGTGNAITSISKAGSVITASKGLTFSLSGHTHTISDISGLQTTLNNKLESSIFNTHNNDNVRHITGAERTKWDAVVTDFDNLEIGGRNLIRYSDFSQESNINKWVLLDTARSAQPINFGGRHLSLITINNYEIGDKARIRSEANIPLVKGTTYTISYYGAASGWFNDAFDDGYYKTPDSIYINLPTPSKTLVGEDIYNGVNRYIYKYTSQFTFDEETSESAFFLLGGHTNYGTGGPHWFMIGEIKLEKGNKATDWTPAPEDQVSDWLTTDVNSFSFIKNKPTLLSQFTDNIGVATHIAKTSNPHSVTKAQVGLGNVDNTSDLNKPISNAVQAALNLKAVGGLTVDFTSTASLNNSLNGMVSGSIGSPISGASVVGTWTTLAVNNSYGGGFFTRLGRAFTLGKENGVIGEWQELAYLTSNVASATKLQTPRAIWGQSFDGTENITGALSGATTITASTSVTVPKVIFNAAGWSMEQVGSELQMKHNNVLKMRFTSAGSIVATEEITAFG